MGLEKCPILQAGAVKRRAASSYVIPVLCLIWIPLLASPASAATPYRAQLAGAVAAFVGQITLYHLTGWSVLPSSELPQRRCDYTEISKLASSRTNREAASAIHRECSLFDLQVDSSGKNLELTSSLGSEHCDTIKSLIVKSWRVILGRKSDVDSVPNFSILSQIRSETGLELDLNRNFLSLLSKVNFTISCDLDRDLVIRVPLRRS